MESPTMDLIPAISPFQYKPLDPRPTPTSRFMCVQVRSQSETQYLLKNRELDLMPQYTAISYMWGPLAPMQSILLENETNVYCGPRSHRIGKNLYDFLEAHKTYPWGEALGIWNTVWGHLWIDQICIDQSNLVERNDQVSIMNLVYKKANKALVWLGCEPDMAEAAGRLRDKHTNDLEALARLLRHPYFSRLWIVQEISLSTKVFVLCREVVLEWGALVDAVNRLENRHIHSTLAARVDSGPPHRSHPGLSQAEIPAPALALIRESKDSLTLERCIANFCHNGCQDPRDKVYALLGLTSERWRVRIDYRKPVFDVYVEAVIALFEELFDRLDPQCFYREPIGRESGTSTYINTTLALAEAMGLPLHHVKGLPSFLKAVLGMYLDTPLRNVEYPYQLPVLPSYFVNYERHNKWRSGNFPDQEAMAQKMDPKWADILVTRRNPLMQDVLPAMGLKVIQPGTNDANSQGCDQRPVLDQWWFKYDGHVHYFDCPAQDEGCHPTRYEESHYLTGDEEVHRSAISQEDGRSSRNEESNHSTKNEGRHGYPARRSDAFARLSRFRQSLSLRRKR